MIWLSEKDLKKLLEYSEAIAAVREAYKAFSNKQSITPLRTPIAVKKHQGVSLFMPAHLEDYTGLKIVSVYPDNHKQDLPTILGIIAILDASTGKPLAIMDATYLTGLRTGAASGVATDILALPSAKNMTIIGAGSQAIHQIKAILTVRKIQTVFIYDLEQDKARQLAEELTLEYPTQFLVIKTPEEGVHKSEIVTTVTTSIKPVFSHEAILPGTHINAIGGFTPEMQEIPEAIVTTSQIFVDSIDAVLKEAGDIIKPINNNLLIKESLTEIGEVISGLKSGRKSEEEITLFKSVGLAVQDIAVAGRITNKALASNTGVKLDPSIAHD